MASTTADILADISVDTLNERRADGPFERPAGGGAHLLETR